MILGKTPIYKIGKIDGSDIYIKREDFIPFSFGGNKGRIVEEYKEDMFRRGCDCMVGYGNARSNLCRVLSNEMYRIHIPCHIVSPSDDDGSYIETSNSKLTKLTGAVIHQCDKSRVSAAIDSVLSKLKKEGYNPYYINGDSSGHGNEHIPVEAYCKVYKEIADWQEVSGIKFDAIFLATGTGMTQAGLIAGKMLYGGSSKIIGISIARTQERVIGEITNFVEKYFYNRGENSLPNKEIFVMDEFLGGGYGKYGLPIIETIKEMYKSYGIPLDTTYTGKAFWGMKQYIKNKMRDKNILFIHTGGTPLFFDNIDILNNGKVEDK